ncbi:hypothetical protein BDP27DRAFT_1312950 [Rhodocollybia butyracea]|uniref:Uncharacterized protein n=1 Tax=Rhodocollybia butyracea TaxID=206335 RepID=A0A9P5UF81_9AGAR|nr:hypothetical protein BDP27DRAFT_1312950 [Rhodocollybia butyracea]
MTSILQRSATLPSFTSFPLESNNDFVVLATQKLSEHMTRAMDSEQESVVESQYPVAGPSTPRRPLQEEKTEPYYPDDTRKAPQPTPEELSAFRIKIRDFAYEANKYPPIKPYKRPVVLSPPDPFQIQQQPDPQTWKGLAVENGSSFIIRQRVFYDLEGLEESQQSNSSPSHSQSQPPLDYGDSQESEPFIETPVVTPNGSLLWKDQSHIPIDQLDVAARMSASEITESKPFDSDPFAPPKHHAAELTLPRLYAPSTRPIFESPSRPAKRQRILPPDSPSPPKQPVIDNVSPRYNLRQRTAAKPPASARGRAALATDISSSQVKFPAKRKTAVKADKNGKMEKGKGRGG